MIPFTNMDVCQLSYRFSPYFLLQYIQQKKLRGKLSGTHVVVLPTEVEIIIVVFVFIL